MTLSEQAKKVHQQTVIVPAKRGTIYDRNGAVIAEDATTYNVYAIIDKKYKSATGKVLYVEESQFKKVAEIFKQYLGMDEDYVIKQLSQKKLKQVSFGSNGNGITYSNMTAIREAMEAAKIEGVAFTTSPNRSYKNGVFASQFIGQASLQEDKEGNKTLKGQSGMEKSSIVFSLVKMESSPMTKTETGISFLVQIRFLSKQKMEKMFIRPFQQNCRPILRHVWMFSKKK